MTKRRIPLMKGLQLLLVFVFLTACSLFVDDIGDDDLVGTWRENRENCENELSECALLIFMEDGHFTATNLPSEYFGYAPLYLILHLVSGKSNYHPIL